MGPELAITLPPSTSNTGTLQFSPITINEDYRKKWRITMNDFICLTVNGELLRPTLYRIGGIGRPNLGTDKYFLLIKQVEAQYSKEIMRMANMDPDRNPNHLDGRWCILDADGNEKVEFDSFKIPHLISGSCIYSIDGTYYNIETGECYGRVYTSFSSQDFVFLNGHFEKEALKGKVMKINKKDGTWELFP